MEGELSDKQIDKHWIVSPKIIRNVQRIQFQPGSTATNFLPQPFLLFVFHYKYFIRPFDMFVGQHFVGIVTQAGKIGLVTLPAVQNICGERASYSGFAANEKNIDHRFCNWLTSPRAELDFGTQRPRSIASLRRSAISRKAAGLLD